MGLQDDQPDLPAAGPADEAAGTGLQALDRLSERLLAAAPSLRVAVAETPSEHEAGYALRYRQVIADGWARADELPDGLERDDHDADALQINAWDGEALVGTLRLVLPAAGRHLPVETAFGLEVEPVGEVAEAGRLVIEPARRGDAAHGVWGALFARAWVTLRARDLAVLAGTASPRMVARLRALGLPFEILGPARPFWGEERHPVRLDPAHGSPRWFQ
ncbi:MAG: Acetyltransferase domain [Solirubrobacteraceae bacterium]|jgi:N-acyl-L-homoserine lactone synthetase|nr:Acetyltransferase domain [Solirubrobacteraceae bacterium]